MSAPPSRQEFSPEFGSRFELEEFEPEITNRKWRDPDDLELGLNRNFTPEVAPVSRKDTVRSKTRPQTPQEAHHSPSSSFDESTEEYDSEPEDNRPHASNRENSRRLTPLPPPPPQVGSEGSQATQLKFKKPREIKVKFAPVFEPHTTPRHPLRPISPPISPRTMTPPRQEEARNIEQEFADRREPGWSRASPEVPRESQQVYREPQQVPREPQQVYQEPQQTPRKTLIRRILYSRLLHWVLAIIAMMGILVASWAVVLRVQRDARPVPAATDA